MSPNVLIHRRFALSLVISISSSCIPSSGKSWPCPWRWIGCYIVIALSLESPEEILVEQHTFEDGVKHRSDL
ncbi:hypothetical protein L210DRAFT_613518 [Boletus edulis BED1]|uniref:Secreted protein n=1 Tax=Boletus edulis BED1 TaxID=1328754 RepID=A0AAD4C696_BOLED|nr:hypothetical protein L210DRAFT_613518 [Boletus edulis BED1]